MQLIFLFTYYGICIIVGNRSLGFFFFQNKIVVWMFVLVNPKSVWWNILTLSIYM